MTDEQMHADKGYDWKLAHGLAEYPDNAAEKALAEIALEAMHDRDRFMAERDSWREQARQLRARLLEIPPP